MQVLHSAEAVTDRITTLGKEIAEDFANKDPLFVCLLGGGNPFASALMFAITEHNPDFHPQMTYMTTSTYEGGRTAGEVRIERDVPSKISFAGRVAIIVDDVLDTGKTLSFTADHLLARGANEVHAAVLARKLIDPRPVDFQVKYVGFDTPDVWLSGMGMDNEAVAPEAYRWDKRILVEN